MKKAILLLLLAFCICVSACTVSPPAPHISEEESHVPSLADSSEDGASSADYSEICEEARRLLLLDQTIIDIFANGALEAELAGEVPPYGEYATLRTDSDYYYIQSVLELLDSTYTEDSAAKNSFVNACPSYGPTAICEGEGGVTMACFTYQAEFERDVENAAISYMGETEQGHYFSYYDGSYSYSFYTADTENGARLTNSLYYIDAEKRQSSAWVQNALSERSGSCGVLNGECVIINVFASDSNSYWTDTARADAKQMLEYGLQFIMDCSVAYGVEELSFSTIDVSLTVSTDAAGFESGSTYADDVFIATEYGDIKQFAEAVCGDIKYNNICVLFHFNKHGRSYFVPCEGEYTADNPLYYEFGVMFYSLQHQGEYFSCPSVYAHELLHAFGAKDLYEGTVTVKGDALAGVLFPSELMRYEPTNIYESQICDLTAKLIGWIPYLNPQLTDLLNECL